MKKVLLPFNKHFKNNDYEILFNTPTGLEITQGINGKEDPFVLELPSLLDIGIMGHCKNKCRICYQGHYKQPNMKLSDFKQIIDEVKHHVNQVALGGRGDPNKHENFREIIEYCRDNNVVPNYTTSGIELTDEEIEISKMCGAVAVSMYSYTATYDALNRFIDAKIKTNIHLVLDRDNHEWAMRIVSGEYKWEKSINDKLNAVIFLLFKPQGAAADMYSLIPTSEQLKKFAKVIFKPKAKFKIGMDSCLVNHMIKYAKMSPLQRMSVDTCEGARMSCYITPDMKFMPCSFADKDKWSVSMKGPKPITRIWQKSWQFKKFRNELETAKASCPLKL